MSDTASIHHDINLDSGNTVRVTPITPAIFRIQVTSNGTFPEAALVRYGVLRTDWPTVDIKMTETEGATTIATSDATLQISTTDGKMHLQDTNGKTLLEEAAPPHIEPDQGFALQFRLKPEDKIYGLGDETRDRIQKRGHKNKMVLRNVSSYAPIPFLMSSGGWGIFLNTTWFHHFDAGATTPDILSYHAKGGHLDYYLIAGATLPLLLDRYTQISGRPHLLPKWAYGLTFVCDERGVRARDVLYESYQFRREGMPCDLIGLEPDWMDKHYDFSVDKKWSQERFHNPFWLEGKDNSTFMAALRNMGFKFSLWLCCDYDLSEHEEAQLGNQTDTLIAPDGDNDDDLFKDPNFHARRFDTITKSGEPWFEHLKKFVDDGASAFKLDGANQICFHPDRKWKNGMPDEEMHNLYPILLNKQMSLGFKEHTGRRAMIYSAGGYAGIQQYSATWAGDTGGNIKPLVSILNHGLSGHSNTSCDMEVWHKEGIHFGFFQPWSQLLSWHMYNQPWFLGDTLAPIFKFYAKLRYRLLPYLYSTAHVAARTGFPMMRAMPLVAPDDPKSDELLTQYMLGDAFLTAAFTETLHLPAGRWIDYWTGERHDGPKDIPCTYPENRGGALLVRGGAIIPTAPDMDYVGQIPLDTLNLDVYPCGKSSFTLYEDDGESYGYLDGKTAETRIDCQSDEDGIELSIAPRQGSYESMPESRSFNVRIHCEAAPESVLVNDTPLPRDNPDKGWSYDETSKQVQLLVHEAPQRTKPITINCQ